jgi:ubiquinone/menaquinone biosynthesis C-methylase UbiE
MTCAAQAAEVLAPLVSSGETLLDVGCAGGYYHWSFASRGVPVEYHGLDYTAECVALAREEMCGPAGLAPDRFLPCAAECLDRDFDTILCFNVLSHNAHFGKPLDVLLRRARKRILIRESLGESLDVRYVADAFIDEDKRHLRTYFNTYPADSVRELMASAGFTVTAIPDRRTGDGSELVCGQPMRWRILLGERRA